MSKEQMTLGSLIKRLKELPSDMDMQNINSPDSYRGDYRDLAFAMDEGTRKVSEVLNECMAAIGQEFEGYKGGHYLMTKDTVVFIADYGSTGDMLVDLLGDGTIVTAEYD